MQQNIVDAAGSMLRRYGLWIILGLMALEIFLARRRGEL